MPASAPKPELAKSFRKYSMIHQATGGAQHERSIAVIGAGIVNQPASSLRIGQSGR